LRRRENAAFRVIAIQSFGQFRSTIPPILKSLKEPVLQRATLEAVAYRGATEIYSQTVREEFRLGAASTVQKALQSLDSKDILDLYKGNYFFIDPLFAHWIRRKATN